MKLNSPGGSVAASSLYIFGFNKMYYRPTFKKLVSFKHEAQHYYSQTLAAQLDDYIAEITFLIESLEPLCHLCSAACCQLWNGR